MRINKKLVGSLYFLAREGNDRKKRKGGSIKEISYPKINLYDSEGQIIGSLRQGEFIDYQELLSKKRR